MAAGRAAEQERLRSAPPTGALVATPQGLRVIGDG
jgi:hypothetical protein